MREARLVFACAALVLAGCEGERTAEVVLPEARVDALVARFPVLAPRSSTAAAKGTTARPARVVLPKAASAYVAIDDEASDVGVRFALRGALDHEAAAARGLVVYPAALGGADIVHRVHAEGTEDYVVFESKPAREELTYDVDVSRVAGLRLVEGSLEFLDASGAPRLRVAAPYLVDHRGTRSAATLMVAGCTYDTSPAGPWARAVTPPGAATCTVRVQWQSASYPLIVDPAWSTTGSLKVPRDSHSMTVLVSGKVLVAAGFGSDTFASAELYDPTSGTFSATGSLNNARAGHTASLLLSGKVLIAGGASPHNGYIASAELYDPVSGTFALTGSLAKIRGNHLATTLLSGKVLIATGEGEFAAPPPTAELYDPVAGTFSATGNLSSGRTSGTATLLPSGKVLFVGGTPGVAALTTAELYDPALGTFSLTGSPVTGRYAHTATALASGKVLIAGGATTLNVPFLTSAELFDPALGTFSATGSLTGERLGGTATRLASGEVLLVGGSVHTPGTEIIDETSAAELYDPSSATFRKTGALALKRAGHTAALLSTARVLVVGGDNPNPIGPAELYDANEFGLAKACATGLDCNSGFCTDGVCCDTLCDGQCQACDVAGHAGTCTLVTGAPHGTRRACGTTAQCKATCDGITPRACTFAITPCGSTCADGRETDSTCNSAGACLEQPAHSCKNLVCADAKSCKTKCVTNADCVAGFVCAADGSCAVDGVCVDDHTSKHANGDVTDCGAYKCATSGACGTTCNSVDDCVAPNVCSADGHCSGGDDSASGCSTTGRGNLDLTLLGLVAFGLVGMIFRKRGSR